MTQRNLSLATRSRRILDVWSELSDKARKALTRMHKHYEREFAPWREHNDQASVAATIHGLVDEEIADQKVATPRTWAQVRCTRGCSHCCKVNVTVTAPEAALLLRYAEHLAHPIDWSLVERQQAYSGPDRWQDQPVADRACVFLSEAGECRVYPHRPGACRRQFVTTDPARCNVELHPGAQVLNWVSLGAEAIDSAALLTFEGGSMPEMLLRVRS